MLYKTLYMLILLKCLLSSAEDEISNNCFYGNFKNNITEK